MSFNSSTQDPASQAQGAPRLPRPGPGLQAPRKRPGVAALWGLLLLLLMPWIAWVSVLPHLHELADQWAQQSAQSQGAVLYKTGYGLSSVVLVACWFISSVLVALAVERAWPELHRTRLVVEGWRVRVCRVEGSNAPAAAGRALNRPGPARARRWKRRLRRSALWWMTALVLKGASVSFVVLDLRAHAAFTTKAYVQSPRLPGSPVVSHPWSTAASVALGCSHSAHRRTTKHDRNRIVYIIQFPDGDVVHLYDAVPLQGSWLDAAQTMDQILRGSGAEFSRWNWLGQDPLHPSCLRWFQDRYTVQDYARLQRLLRIGELPAVH
jgi:hypothetical protein